MLLGLILKILGSAGFGTVFGGVMGYFNRKADLAYKKLEYEDKEKIRLHELKQRELDVALMEKEYAGKIQVAEMEGTFKALDKSYSFAEPEKGSRMAAFSSFIRPFISLSYFVVSSFLCAYVLIYAFKIIGIEFDKEQWYELVNFVIDWLTFMASTTIGWWYAMRAGKAPQREK